MGLQSPPTYASYHLTDLFFRTFSSRRIMKNLKTCVFSAIVILFISFGDEAESAPMASAREGEITSKEAMEIDRRTERDAEASPEEGMSLERLSSDQASEEGTSLDNAMDKKLHESREAGWVHDIFKAIKKAFKKAIKGNSGDYDDVDGDGGWD